jgi:hypothetical protein
MPQEETMNIEIKREDWNKFFDSLSKRRYEWMIEIEVISPDSGDQILSNGLPLNGITLETSGDKTSVDISVGENAEHHQTHTIVDPMRVAFLPDEGEHPDVLDIEEANGTKTLIKFTEPMSVLVGFAEYQMHMVV